MLSIGGLCSGNNIAGWSQNAEILTQQFGPVAVPKGSCQVFLIGYIVGNPGAGTTTLTVRVRRGLTTADPIVLNTGAVNVTAATLVPIPVMGVDVLTEQGTVSYTITVQGAGMAGSGGSLIGALSAFFMQ